MTLDLRLIADGGLAAETDPNNRLSATATTLTVTALARNETAHSSVDYTAGYFAPGAYVEGTINVSAAATSGEFEIGFSNTLSDLSSIVDAALGRILAVGTSGAVVRAYAYLKQSSAFSGNFDATNLLTIGTTYYYRLSFLTSLGGQFGAVVLQTYLESGRATAFSTAVTARTAAVDYRYLMLAASYNVPDAATISATHSNVSIGTVAAGIDLTTGVETDTGTGRLVVYADCIVATALNIANGEAAKHVAIDEGAGFFGDYTISGVLNIASFSSYAGAEQRFNILCVTDAAADALLANDLQGIAIVNNSAPVYTPYMHQAVGGTDTFSTAGPNLNFNQPYSFTMARSGSTLTMKIWNDLVLTNFAGTSQVGSTVTWTGRATTTYRYHMPVASSLNGATAKSATFTLGGVQVLGSSTTGTISETTQDTTGNITGEVSSTTGTISETTQDTTGNVVGVIPTVGTLSETTEDTLGTLSGDTGSTIGTLSETTGDTTGNVVGTLTVLATLSETTEATTGNIEATTPNMGTFSETTADTTGTILGEFSQSPTELFSVTVRNATTGAKLTGLTNVLISVVDDATGYRFDHTDQNFRAVSAIPTLPMTEFSAANNPGYYTSTLTVLTWDSEYTITIEYDDGTRINTWVQSGVEYVNGVRVKVSSRAKPSDIPSAAAIVAVSDAVVVDGSINRAKYERIILAGIGGKRSGIGSAAEQYFGQDGTTVRIAFTPDSSGNGTPVLDGA